MLFWRKRPNDKVLKDMHSEAEALKHDAIKETRKATADFRRLNQLLLANGITIQIHKAAGGGRKHE